MKKYVDVILPLPLPRTFTYSLPGDMADGLVRGCRVLVPFGKKKFYTAIVRDVHDVAPTDYEVKEVTDILDASPVLLTEQFTFWDWIADYYLCTPGDVYKAAFPTGMKIEGDTDELKHTYKPKTEARVRLADAFSSEEKLKDLFDELTRAPKQLALLMKFVELSGFMGTKALKEVSKSELLQRSGVAQSVFNGLVEKGIFEVYHHEVGRLRRQETETVELNPLNEYQQQAHRQLLEQLSEKNVCLLHGVTSSGKTEVYIHLIAETIRQGKQVLYLLPEIALTTQITERLNRVFGSRLGIYHSKFSDAQRVEIWQKQLTDSGYDIILGARSSIFLPFRNLGLIIVDEEHENTYKQQDPAPRYHARNAAIVLASLYGAKTLLGTATPSVETYHNATTGKYGLVELKERYKDIQLPEIVPVDIKELARKKLMAGSFSRLLLGEIAEALSNKEQVILFQNRRGFAPMIECRTCGWVPKCTNCDVSLTYHKKINQLACHYCGYSIPQPRSCPACEGVEMLNRGFGTEKIDDDIRHIFPQARVARMDLDTTRTRTAYEKIIADFEQGKTDILIGTQMVSKGLDFDHVSVVGILNADSMMNFPDFRAYERAYQLMAQVAGRAGRKHKRGKVILQTKSIDHSIIGQVMTNNYEAMVRHQLAERQMFQYPPYYRLVYVYLKNKNRALLEQMANVMAEKLRVVFGNRVLGPSDPPVARVQLLYIKKIIVKIEINAPLNRARELLKQVQREMLMDERFKSLILYYDVDPM